MGTPPVKIDFDMTIITVEGRKEQNSKMADAKLESIKNLMAITDLESAAKNDLLKLVMADELEVTSGTKITEKDGLFTLTKPELAGTFHIPELVETFRLVAPNGSNDWKKQLHGPRVVVDNSNVISEYYYDNGVSSHRSQYVKAADSYATYPNDGKFETESFAKFPFADKSNLEKLEVKHFKKWLIEMIIIEMANGNPFLVLDRYGKAYIKHLPWLETFAKCKGYILEKRDSSHRLSWPESTSL